MVNGIWGYCIFREFLIFLSIFSWVWTNKSMVSQIGNVSYNDPNNSPTWSFQVQKHHSGIWQWTTAPCFHSQIIWQVFPFHCQVGVPSSAKMVRLIVEIAKIPWIHRPACQLLHPQGAAARCLAWKGLGRSEFLIHVFEDRFSNIAMNIHKTTSHFDMNIIPGWTEPSTTWSEPFALHKNLQMIGTGEERKEPFQSGFSIVSAFFGTMFPMILKRKRLLGWLIIAQDEEDHAGGAAGWDRRTESDSRFNLFICWFMHQDSW